MKIRSEGEKIIIGDFNEIEALKIALKLENEGLKFYLKLAEMVSDPEARQVFLRLAEDEEKHYHIFKGKLERIMAEKKGNLEIDKGEEEDFFNSIDAGVFGNILEVEKLIKKVKKDIDAVSFGQEAEVNSINFYKAILESTCSEETKKVLHDIIKEEQKHLKKLVDISPR